MAATLLTLATGRTLEVAMTYDDAKAYFIGEREREVTLTDGRRITLNTGLVQMKEEVGRRQAVGFR